MALAGLGLDRTQLPIIADPTIRSHVVEIEAEGAFGSFRFCEDVLPTADEPEDRQAGGDGGDQDDPAADGAAGDRLTPPTRATSP